MLFVNVCLMRKKYFAIKQSFRTMSGSVISYADIGDIVIALPLECSSVSSCNRS